MTVVGFEVPSPIADEHANVTLLVTAPCSTDPLNTCRCYVNGHVHLLEMHVSVTLFALEPAFTNSEINIYVTLQAIITVFTKC